RPPHQAGPRRDPLHGRRAEPRLQVRLHVSPESRSQARRMVEQELPLPRRRMVVVARGRIDKETRRQGDKETRRQGDEETRRQGDKEKARRCLGLFLLVSPSPCLLVYSFLVYS